MATLRQRLIEVNQWPAETSLNAENYLKYLSASIKLTPSGTITAGFRAEVNSKVLAIMTANPRCCRAAKFELGEEGSITDTKPNSNNERIQIRWDHHDVGNNILTDHKPKKLLIYQRPLNILKEELNQGLGDSFQGT